MCLATAAAVARNGRRCTTTSVVEASTWEKLHDFLSGGENQELDVGGTSVGLPLRLE